MKWIAPRIIAVVAVAVSLWGATAASAQETGKISAGSAPIRVQEGRTTGDRARAVQDKFAVCIVRRNYVKVVKALSGPQSMQGDYDSLPKLMDKRCFFGSDSVEQIGGSDSLELKTGPVTFRGSLFKALVLKDFSRRPVPFLPTPPTFEGDNSEMIQFADCAIRRDPEASMTLFKAVAGTTAEDLAIGALEPHMQQCMVPAQLSSQRSVLIGFLAEAYYREADASRKTSAS